MGTLIDQIRKSAKNKIAEEFKSDDGISTVPDVAFGGDTPSSAAKKVKKLEKPNVDEDNVDELQKKETVGKKNKDLGTNSKKPEIWGESRDDRDDDDNEDDDDDRDRNRDREDDEDERDDDDDDDREDDNDDDREDDDEDDDNDRAPRKVTREDLNVKEHLSAIFGKETLTEEFKDKTRNIFEAAVVDAANGVLGPILEEIEAEKNAEIEAVIEAMIDKIDLYLDKVINEWIEENEVAIEYNVRTDIAESFLTGLKTLFDDHYVTIDEEKVDVVEELIARVESLENSLDEEINKNVSLIDALTEARKEALITGISEGLSENEVERLKMLSEGVEYDGDDDTYLNKINDIKESYFNKDVRVNTVHEDDAPVYLNEEIEPKSKVSSEIQPLADKMTKYFRKY